jgi:hypothetical protein
MNDEKRHIDNFEEEIFKKEYENLTPEEKEFVSDFASNEKEFNALKDTFFGVSDFMKKEDIPGPSEKVKEDLMKSFRAKNSFGGKILGMNATVVKYAAAAVLAVGLISTVFIISLNKDQEVVTDNVIIDKKEVAQELNQNEAVTKDKTVEKLEQPIEIAEAELDVKPESDERAEMSKEVALNEEAKPGEKIDILFMADSNVENAGYVVNRSDKNNNDIVVYNNPTRSNENVAKIAVDESVLSSKSVANASKSEIQESYKSDKYYQKKSKTKGQTLADVSYLMGYMQVAY